MFLESIDFNKKKIILRVDFNVPFKDGSIQSTKRIDAAMPTINLILKKREPRERLPIQSQGLLTP